MNWDNWGQGKGKWNIDHIIFFGFLYLALGVVVAGLTYSFFKSWMDLSKEEELPQEIPYRKRYCEY